MPRGLGPIQKKILILLVGGLSLGLSYSPRQRYTVLRQMGEEWEKVNDNSLRRAIASLYKSRLINMKEKEDGTVAMLISNKGKRKMLEYKLDEIKIKKPKRWDGAWRVVLFDIPKNEKKVREILRAHLKRLNFYQYQKSVFVHPYECSDELDFLIEFYRIRPYVRTMVTNIIDNDLHLRKIFEKIKLI